MKLTHQSFDALRALASFQDGTNTAGARLVLVDGLSVPAAAAQVGTTSASLHNVVSKWRKAARLAREAAAGVTI